MCVLVTQLCMTLCDSMNCSLPGSSVHVILQARILEWVAIPFSRGIFPIQGSNPGLLLCRQILYQLSHKGRPAKANRKNFLYEEKRRISIPTYRRFLISNPFIGCPTLLYLHNRYKTPYSSRTLGTFLNKDFPNTR